MAKIATGAMEEIPDTIQVNITNKFTNLSKELIVYVSDDVNLYQHIYNNPSVHSAYVRTWPAATVSAVKDGTKTIICSIENTPILLSLAQMKNTTTRELYHHVAKTGMLSNINFVLDVVRSDSLADEMTVNSDVVTNDGLETTQQYPHVEETPSELILSNALQTMNIKVQNQFTMRSTVLDIKISEEVNIFDEIYDNPAMLKAQIRSWSSDIVAGIKNESQAIVASVSGTPMRITISQMKKTSTKQLQDFVYQATPRQHPQLILGIVKSYEIPEIDTRLKGAIKSSEDRIAVVLPKTDMEDDLDDIFEIGATDSGDSIPFDKEDSPQVIEANFVQPAKSEDVETMQGSTELETDTSVHEDDETIVAGNETPKTTPRPQHETPPNLLFPSSATNPKVEIDDTEEEDTAFIATLNFDSLNDLGQKTSYSFPEDQTGFEITFDQEVDNVFKVSITEERFDGTEGNPNRKSKKVDENTDEEKEEEEKNEEDFGGSDMVSAKLKESSVGDETTATTDSQTEIEASFVPADIGSLSRTVEVIVNYQAEESVEEIELGVELSPEDAPVESGRIAADEDTSRITVEKEKESARIASAKMPSRARGIAVRSSQSLSQAQAAVIQSAFRRSVARESYKRDVLAIVKVQSLGRRRIAKQKLMKHEHAAGQSLCHAKASIIQTAFRGSLARMSYNRDVLAIVKVQSLGRRWIAKQKLMNRKHHAALKIQSVEQHRASKIQSIVQQRASRIQSIVQHRASKIQSNLLQRASKNVTSNRQHELKIKESRSNKACKLQSVYRGHKARRDINSQHKAAIQIQYVYRGRLASVSAKKQAHLKVEEAARISAEKGSRLAPEAQAKSEEEARLIFENGPKLVSEAEAKTEEGTTLEATLIRLKAKEDARLKAEEEARLKVEEEARVVAEAQAKAEEAIATLELEEEARQKADEEAKAEEEGRSKSLDQTTTEFDDSEGIEIEYSLTGLEDLEHGDERQQALYVSVASEIKSASDSDAAPGVSDEIGVDDANDEAVHLLSAAMECSETQTKAEACEVEDSEKQQKDVGVNHETSIVGNEVASRNALGNVSVDDLDSNTSRTNGESTSSESRKQENDSVVETQTAVHTMNSCETYGIDNSKPSVNEALASKTKGIATAEPEVALHNDVRIIDGDGKRSNGVTMVTMAGTSVNEVGSQGSNSARKKLSREERRIEKESERKVGLSTSSQDSLIDTNSTSSDTIDMIVMGVKDRSSGAVGANASNKQEEVKQNDIEENKQKAVILASQEINPDTNSTSLDTLDRLVIGLENSGERDVSSSNAASSQSREKRDESAMNIYKANNSTTQVTALNREQVPDTPEGTQEGNPQSSKSDKSSSMAPLPAIVTTRNRDGRQASQAASVCSSLNTSPSYYEKFDSKIGSKMILKALHTPISNTKSPQDFMSLSDDDQSSKPEAASVASKVSLKDDIITLTASYEKFAKQLKSLMGHANEFHKAICEKEKARGKFFEECTSMTNGTPLYLNIGKNEIPKSANLSYAQAEVEDTTPPRSMASVHAIARIYSSASCTEFQQQILTYVTAWTEAVTSKVEVELQTYDKLEEMLYHYEVKVDDLRKKSKGKTSTQLTRNYKKLATAGQKRDKQLEKTCYLLKAVVDNSWKDLYPLIEQTMLWETNRRDGQIDTMGMMLPKTMASMKENIKSGKTLLGPDQESLEAELSTQTRENRKLQYRINKLEAILRSDDWSNKNEMISKLSSFNFSSAGRTTTAE